jgi:hypothetical protein
MPESAWQGQSRDNTRSFKYEYDQLDRLIRSDTGKLNATLDAIETSGSGVPMPVLSSWNLGRVDSWNGTTGTNGVPGFKREGDINGSGTWAVRNTWHATDHTNQITSVSVDTVGATPVPTSTYYDKAGNLVFDGTYFYEYDALNRLMRVSLPGALTFSGTTFLTYTSREYIWGPDYVDELVCQIAPGGNGMGTGEAILYAITGHAGTIAALLNTSGVVQAQYSFDPYGELLASDYSGTMPRDRVENERLFCDRLTGTVLVSSCGEDQVKSTTQIHGRRAGNTPSCESSDCI